MKAKSWTWQQWWSAYERQCAELHVAARLQSDVKHAYEEGLTPHWCAREMNNGPITTKTNA